MLPTKIEQDAPESTRRHYAIVRRDTMDVVPGLILVANCETGIFMLKLANGAAQEFNLGPGMIRIIVAGRR